MSRVCSMAPACRGATSTLDGASVHAGRSLRLPWKSGATSRMKRSISSFTWQVAAGRPHRCKSGRLGTHRAALSRAGHSITNGDV